MRVKDVMSPRPVTVTTDTTVGTAIRLLAGHGVTALPVVDPTARIVGIVSEADLILGRIQPDPLLGSAPGPFARRNRTRAGDLVEDVMSRPIVVVHPETDLEEVERIVTATGVKSLPVVDAADQVVGVVSRSDVVRALARDDESLEQDIADALALAGLSRYRVEVRNGVVQLRTAGTRDRAELVRALDMVTATPGVTAVHAC
ncbi:MULTISPECIES: CBS domain-containing protein [Nocardioides]|uniref:CBS domain-containing protein n=1 Tax=Nocardioides vastitatis TaxID=2568655 RepID=A0ABW0ZJ07_9ACTN|nr:CBS domain-containing protein [Nocardioides sp.]